MFASIVVKKTFQSLHRMHDPHMNGRYLSIAYTYDDERASVVPSRSFTSTSTVGGEVQIFDLLRLEGK